MTRDPLPATLTTLDLLKTWAVILMLIDLIGAFFFPVRGVGSAATGDPVLWLRVIGCMSMPVWFFLIGYARSRDLSRPLWLAATIMLAASIIAGVYVFPLDVLWTIILIRLIIDRVAVFAMERVEHLGLVLLGLALFSIPAPFITDYGTIGFVLALTGWAVRHHGAEHPKMPILAKPYLLPTLYWAAFVGIFFHAVYVFSFDRPQLVVATLGAGLVLHLLMKLQVQERPDVAARLGPTLTPMVQWTGRHTLIIYVTSVLSLVALCWGFGLGLPVYRFMDWEWTMMESVAEMHATTGTRAPTP